MGATGFMSPLPSPDAESPSGPCHESCFSSQSYHPGEHARHPVNGGSGRRPVLCAGG